MGSVGSFTPEELRNLSSISQVNQTVLQKVSEDVKQLNTLADFAVENIDWSSIFQEATSGKTFGKFFSITVKDKNETYWNPNSVLIFTDILRWILQNKLNFKLIYKQTTEISANSISPTPDSIQIDYYLDWSN